MIGQFTGHDDEITGLAFTIDDKALASSSGDCTILIWDVSAKTVAKTATNGNLDQDWQLLRGEDAQKAFTAMRRLAAHPETVLKIASEHLRPAEPIDPQWLASRLRDLDHQEFSERERATRELEEFGDRVASALEKFLATKPSLEASKRGEKILEKNRGRVAVGQAAQSLRLSKYWNGSARPRRENWSRNWRKGLKEFHLRWTRKGVLRGGSPMQSRSAVSEGLRCQADPGPVSVQSGIRG